MGRFLLGWASMMAASIAWCCPTVSTPGANAVKSLYLDKEIVQYVCNEEPCDINAFTERLSIEKVRLARSARAEDGLQIEPSVKGTQYFSYIYLLDPKACEYLEVFAADTSFSGAQVLKEVRHGYHIIRAHERQSIEHFSTADFSFDPVKRSYVQTSERCFDGSEDIVKTVKCH